MADHYEVLGVVRGATADEIKRAYRQRARELHPDTNPDPTAETRFKEVALAYEVLSDPQRRQQYDQFGDAGPQAGNPFGGGAGLGDIFDMFFNGSSPFGGGSTGPSGPPRGQDLEAVVDLPFAEAVFGAEADVSVRTAVPCDDCEATGAAPGTAPVTCPECNGAGQVRRVRQSILGQMVTAGPCTRCSGFGSIVETPCPTCRGEGRHIDERVYTVDVPAGVDTGATLRLSGRGAVGPRGGGAGDLYVHLRVTPDERFTRDGDDLIHDLHIPVTQASLGARVPFDTLDGEEIIDIEPGTQTGAVTRLRQRGVPHLQGRGRGDLLVHVVVDTPTELTVEEAELLGRLAELRGDSIEPPEQGLMSKLRSAFK